MGDSIGNQPAPTVKGPRNYIQLSDGSDDLAFNSKIYVTDNNVINGHSSGSGTATQVAFFDGASSIVSTPAATVGTGGANEQILLGNGSESVCALGFQNSTNTGIYRVADDQIGVAVNGALTANVAAGGLTIGEVGRVGGSLKRLSAIYANSWEDGHLGNSTQLVFTPSDFYNGSQTSSQAPSVESSQPNPAARNSKWYGVVDANGIICAQKIIPKGFAIDEESAIIVYTGGGVNIRNTTVYVSGQRVSQGAIALTTLNILSVDDYTTNALVQANGRGTITGDGMTMVTIYFEAGVALTTTNSVSGALITMKRV